MCAKAIFKTIFLGLALVLLICSPCFLRSVETAKGNLIGFIYDKDGTTPLQDAVVKIKNISSGAVYESNKSDELGIFKIQGLESGMYICGVTTPNGDFNADNLFGVKIHEKETAKMSIALTPYDNKETAGSMAEVYKEQEISGESLIGKINEYNPSTEMANVYIIKGSLSVQDRIHAKGAKTDFYQNVSVLKREGAPVKRLFAGQTAALKLKKEAENGDLVYLVCKRGILPLFLAPLGVASIVAGSAAIIQQGEEMVSTREGSPKIPKR
jgi:hypothetical protein